MKIEFIQPDFTDKECKEIHDILTDCFETIQFNDDGKTISARTERWPFYERYGYDLKLIEIVKGIADKYKIMYNYQSNELYFMAEFKKDVIDNTKYEDNNK